MSIINKNTTHKKYTSEWKNTIKALVGKAVETKLNELETINQELNQKKSAVKKVEDAIWHLQGVEREKARLTVLGNDLTTYSNNFKTTWQTEGWNKKVQDFYKDAQDNIYKIKIGTTESETTEEQIINTVARVVRALEKVDIADFTAKYNAKESDAAKRKIINDTLTTIQNWSTQITVGSDKDAQGNAKQRTYDFVDTYLKGKFADNGDWEADTTAPWTATNQFDYKQLGEFLELVKATDFLDTLDADKQKDIPQSEDWKIFGKGAKYRKEQLKDYGIIIDDSKTSLYKTDSTKSQTFKVEQGLKDWISLAQAVLPKANYEKLAKNFTDSINKQLLNDSKTYKGDYSDAWIFPESIDELEKLEVKLEMEKLSGASNINQAEIEAKQTELESKETELDALFKTAITNLRDQLKKLVPDLSKGKAFNKVSDSEDYRQTYSDLTSAERLLLSIRYLENNGDCSQPSSVEDENTALANIETIEQKILNLARTKKNRSDITSCFMKSTGTDKWEFDISHGITFIKSLAGSDEDFQKLLLTEYKEALEAYQKEIKLHETEASILTALKKELGQNPDSPDIPEKLSDWQTTLKAVDPLLTESIITEAKKKDWEKYPHFKQVAAVKTWLEKVLASDKKLKADFKSRLTTADAEITDLASAFTKLEAKPLITLISRYEYDNLPDSGETEDKKQKTQTERRIKVLLSKTASDMLSEEELNTTLFEVAAGNQTLSTKYYKADLTEITPQKNPPNENKEQSWLRADNWQVWAVFLGIPLLIAGFLAIICWKQLTDWWNGPMEDQTADEAEKEESTF